MNLKCSRLINSYLSKYFVIRAAHRGLSYEHNPGDVPLLAFTAGQLLERAAEKNPDKNAFIFTTPGVKLTFQQLFQQVLYIIFYFKICISLIQLYCTYKESRGSIVIGR